MSDLQEWWSSVPPATKLVFGTSLALTLGANLGFVDMRLLFLHWPWVYNKFEVWRVFTTFFFYGKLSFGFLINMSFLYRFSRALEQNQFADRQADYVFFLLFGAVLLLLVSLVAPFNLPVLGPAFMCYIIYLWARKNHDQVMNFMFGLQFKALYLPFVLCAFKVLMGGMPYDYFAAIACSHLYFFLNDLYPLRYSRRILYTPRFLLNMFPPAVRHRDDDARAANAAAANAPPADGFQWGHGRRLE